MKDQKINQSMLMARNSKKFQDLKINPSLSREKAKEMELVLYYDETKNCEDHLSVRYTRDGVCKECYKRYCLGLIKSEMISRDRVEKPKKEKPIKETKKKETVKKTKVHEILTETV